MCLSQITLADSKYRDDFIQNISVEYWPIFFLLFLRWQSSGNPIYERIPDFLRFTKFKKRKMFHQSNFPAKHWPNLGRSFQAVCVLISSKFAEREIRILHQLIFFWFIVHAAVYFDLGSKNSILQAALLIKNQVTLAKCVQFQLRKAKDKYEIGKENQLSSFLLFISYEKSITHLENKVKLCQVIVY